MPLPLYYNWRNLRRRKLSTTLTMIVVAVVVLVLAVLLSFGAGIQESLDTTALPRNIVVVKRGATSESTSLLQFEEAARLIQTPHLARSDAGELLLSRELSLQTSIPRRNADRNLANVALRGVDDIAFDVHRNVAVVQGRKPQQGTYEVVVGKAASDRYENLDLGSEIELGKLGNRVFTVVGIFEADGGALESEIWVPRTVLADVFGRRFVSSVTLTVTDESAVDPAIEYMVGPTVELDGKTEREYYAELSKTTREIVLLTISLVSIMVVGAIFAVANTMYSAVDGRKREIAMLRTIGFSPGAILLAFVAESLLICTMACALGLGLCLLALRVGILASRQDFLSDVTWTVLAYELRITPTVLVSALVASVVVGVAGALAPARKASRTKVMEALRKA